MPFTWVQNIAVGATIDSADITEMRTNIDTVDGEKCTTNLAGAGCTGDNGTYISAYDDHCSFNYPGYDGENCPGYCSGQNGSYVP